MSIDHVFHIGDKVVYPNHGVGIIEQISSRTIGATVERFYLLKIAASSLKVMIPFHNVSSVGMRPVVRNGEVQKIVDYLSTGECINAADWKDRFKENSERMRTGSLTDVAAVLKSLLILNQAKSLSFREKKMLERARYLLVSEIAISRNCDESRSRAGSYQGPDQVQPAVSGTFGTGVVVTSLRFRLRRGLPRLPPD